MGSSLKTLSNYENLDSTLSQKFKDFRKIWKLDHFQPIKNCLIFGWKNLHFCSTLELKFYELKTLAKFLWVDFNQENNVFFEINSQNGRASPGLLLAPNAASYCCLISLVRGCACGFGTRCDKVWNKV